MNGLGIIKKPQLGGDVDAYCGRCKESREHVIAALNQDGAIGRVQCRTCQSNHIYRERKTRAAASPRSSRKEATVEIDESGPLKPYAMTESFKIGDRVEHARFGIGVVVGVRSEKIDVKFGRELKILIHAG